ncbi:QacE family quaternary ammonium compound efflux SMR transporter [Micrococcales bacterium 31B]|nr:QacE family quaternary ammonium compound efflux SMR transporter [Micrococcales bacterium 31B]
MGWLFLAAAIAFEVAGTLTLRVASHGKAWAYAIVVPAYVLAFAMLAQTLTHGVGLGVAYGVWSAVGVALTAVASKYLFREPFNAVMALGIVCIMGGVLLIEVGGVH